MNEQHNTGGNLVDTTDCLEAIDVFKGWKNFFFLIVILSLLALQASFWLVNTGFVKTCEEQPPSPIFTKVAGELEQPALIAAGEEEQKPKPDDEIATAAKELVAEANIMPEPAKAVEAAKPARQRFKLNLTYLNWIIRFCNFVLIMAATLYCLTILFSLKISLQGRLGGIKHISKAFFLSLIVLVLLLPWQVVFEGILAGVIYTPQELLNATSAAAEGSIFIKALLYARFTGYWLLVLLILMFAQFRSRRWTMAILRRLEVI